MYHAHLTHSDFPIPNWLASGRLHPFDAVDPKWATNEIPPTLAGRLIDYGVATNNIAAMVVDRTTHMGTGDHNMVVYTLSVSPCEPTAKRAPHKNLQTEGHQGKKWEATWHPHEAAFRDHLTD